MFKDKFNALLAEELAAKFPDGPPKNPDGSFNWTAIIAALMALLPTLFGG